MGYKESDMTERFSLTHSLKETQVSFIVIGPCFGTEEKKNWSEYKLAAREQR